MLAAAQAVEHYEISRYGTLVAWAQKLDLGDAAQLREQTLNVEKLTDASLTALAESEINVEAERVEEGGEEEERPRRAAGGRRKWRGEPPISMKSSSWAAGPRPKCRVGAWPLLAADVECNKRSQPCIASWVKMGSARYYGTEHSRGCGRFSRPTERGPALQV
jgi:hypothetical protein